MPENYRLRGNRVAPLSHSQIKAIATNIAKALGFNRRNKKKLDQSFEPLSTIGVTVNPIDDIDWMNVTLNTTKGHFDPNTMTISIPEKLYNDACVGERDALAVMLHELGHLFLSHRAVLHHSEYPATIEEDAEWQADTFADVILKIMGYETSQLSFDFYM